MDSPFRNRSVEDNLKLFHESLGLIKVVQFFFCDLILVKCSKGPLRRNSGHPHDIHAIAVDWQIRKESSVRFGKLVCDICFLWFTGNNHWDWDRFTWEWLQRSCGWFVGFPSRLDERQIAQDAGRETCWRFLRLQRGLWMTAGWFHGQWWLIMFWYSGLASDIFNIFCGFGRALVDRDNDSSVLVCWLLFLLRCAPILAAACFGCCEEVGRRKLFCSPTGRWKIARIYETVTGIVLR